MNENCSWKGVGTEIDLVDNVSVNLNAYEIKFSDIVRFFIDVHF